MHPTIYFRRDISLPDKVNAHRFIFSSLENVLSNAKTLEVWPTKKGSSDF